MSAPAGRHENRSAPLPIGPTRARATPDSSIDAVWNALGSVYDPELCLDVVSLGLVYDVREQDGEIVVEMTLTTPGCPASESLPEMAKMAVAEALGPGLGVEVRVVWDPPWNPAMMHDDAAEALGFKGG